MKGTSPPYVLLPGDPKRSAWWQASGTKLTPWPITGARHLPAFRNAHQYQHRHGRSSTAIAMEELVRWAPAPFWHRHLRHPSGLHPQRRPDCLRPACRYDGTSRLYAPPESPAAAHYEVINACVDAARALGLPFHVGATRSSDTFFAGHPAPGSSFNGYWNSSWAHLFEDLRRMNVFGAEMEASIVLVLARLWGLRRGYGRLSGQPFSTSPTVRTPSTPRPSSPTRRRISGSSPAWAVNLCSASGRQTAGAQDNACLST